MKSTPDLPTDPLGGLGKPIRPEAPKQPDPVKPFENGDWCPDGLVITEKPMPIVTDGQEADWEGLCADQYTRPLGVI